MLFHACDGRLFAEYINKNKDISLSLFRHRGKRLHFQRQTVCLRRRHRLNAAAVILSAYSRFQAKTAFLRKRGAVLPAAPFVPVLIDVAYFKRAIFAVDFTF